MKNIAVTEAGIEPAISIIGPGMRVDGGCQTEGSLRIEGIVEGSVRAGKAVVIGPDGVVTGDVVAPDVVVAGRVQGSITASSRLDLEATCKVDGEITASRVRLAEGGVVNGKVSMGEKPAPRYNGPDHTA
jgi:cytoskeletal protein CcmA (bactofilin family)